MVEILLDGIVGWDITGRELARLLPEDKAEPVHIRLDSPGGDPFEGFNIYQMLRGRQNVTVEIGALVASAASYIPLAAERIVAHKTSTWMAHQAWAVAIGTADDLQKEAAVLEGIDGLIAETYAERTGKDLAAIRQAMRDELWLFGGDAIKEYGMADEVIDAPAFEGDQDVEAEPAGEMQNSMRQAVYAALTQYLSKRGAETGLPLDDKEEEMKKKQAKAADAAVQVEATAQAEAPQEAPVQEQPAEQAAVNVQDQIDAAVRAERERIMGILALGNVQMTDVLKGAIETGQSKGDFAVAQLEAYRRMPQANTQAIGAISPAQEPKDEAKVESLEEKARRLAERQVKILKGEIEV